MVLFVPFPELVGRCRAFGNTDFLAVQRLGIRLIIGLGRGHEDIVRLNAQRKSGEIVFLRAFRGVGDVGHDVDISVFELLEQLAPGVIDVLIALIVERGYHFLILVDIARARHIVGIGDIGVRQCVARTHNFGTGVVRRSRRGRQESCQ